MDELLEHLDKYPYSTNLRLLVLLKARQIHHPDYEAYLSSFASSTFDRSQLYNLLAALEQQEASGSDVLELIELDELELAPLENTFNEEIPSRLNELPEPQGEAPRPPVPEIKPISLEPFDDEPRFPALSPSVARTVRWVRTAEAYTSLLPQMFNSPRPEDPARFATLHSRHQPQTTLSERLRNLRKISANRAPGANGNGIEEAAAVVSETLAALLVRQEQYQSAIQMYRRLILLYPEKKTIFAGLIQELKEKL